MIVQKSKSIVATLFFLVFFTSLTNVQDSSAFLPLMGGTNIIQDSVQGFCNITNQTQTLHCSSATTTLHVTHGKGMTVNLFPSNQTIYVNATGAIGPAGPQGPTGATGPQGTAGSQIYTGAGAPSAGLGINGDFYINVSNGDYYSKSGGSWVLKGNLTGPQGPVGPTGPAGSNGTNGRNGTNGTSAFFNNITCGSNQFVNAYNNATHLATCALPLNTAQIGAADNGESLFASRPNATLNNLKTLRNATSYMNFNHNTTSITPVFLFKVNTTTCPANSAFISYNNSTGLSSCQSFGNVTNINDLGDVVITSVSSGQILQYQSPVWKNISFKANTLSCPANQYFVSFSNSTGTLTCSTVTLSSLNNAGHVSTAPTNTGTICLTNQTTTCGAAFPMTGAAPKVSINGNNRSSFISVANTTSANTINTHSVSFPNTNSGTLLLGNGSLSSLTGTLQALLGVTTLSNDGHVSTFPSNTGTLLLTNGSLSSLTGNLNTVGGTFTGTLSGGILSGSISGTPTFTGNPFTINNLSLGGQMNLAGNTLQSSGHVYTFPSNTGTVMLTNSSGSSLTGIVTSVTGTANQIASSGSTGAITLSIPSTLDLTGKTLKTDSSGQVIRNPAKTFAYSIASSAITANRTINLPLTTQTETFAVQPALNSTTPSDPTGTTSTTGVMTGMLAGFTPNVTGRVQIIIEGDLSSLLAADGVKIDARYGTGASPANGAALSGTVCGKAVQVTAVNSAANLLPFTLTCQVTGLTVGTHIWIEAGQYAISASTASIKNIAVSVMEI